MIRLEKLSFSYAAAGAGAGAATAAGAALRDLSVEIREGRILLISGATGSGKSTLLRLAAGLLKPTSGRLSCDDKDLELGAAALVFQRPERQLFADTLLKDVAFGPRNLGLDEAAAEERARAALRKVGLDPDEFGGRSPFELSGGQARRGAIAGVLAMDAKYVLMDEPTAGLDGAGKRFVCDLLRELKREGRGVAVVSHELDLFLPLADEVLLMCDGRAVWQGSAKKLLAAPECFGYARLQPPGILAFQQDLGCLEGGLSYDPVRVAAWAVAGYECGGPLGHRHGGCCCCCGDCGDDAECEEELWGRSR